MISDYDLHRLAIFLGSCAMLLIVLYHFLEVNANDDDSVDQKNNNKKNTGSASPANAGKAGNFAVATDGVPFAAAAAAAGGSGTAAVGGKGR